MRDPTREDMLTVLKAAYSSLDISEDDMEVAIYWFASLWHSGQGSNLYSVLCTSPYTPGPNTTTESEGEMVGIMIETLEAAFQQGF